jgi:hypothetical protein
MKNLSPFKSYRHTLFIAGIFTFLSLVSCSGANDLEIKNRSIATSTPSSPMAHSISKFVLTNGSTVFDLSSLFLSESGIALAFIEILSLPQHGNLELVSPGIDSTIHTFSSNDTNPPIKFDGYTINPRFLPNKDYTGKDSFTYRATDSNGNQSKVKTVTMIVGETIPPKHNHLPLANNIIVSTPSQTPLHIDLHSLTLDLDGEPLEIYVPTSEKTFNKTSHGIIESHYWLNYLPNTIGKETITYIVSDSSGHKSTGKITINITEEKRGGNFRLLVSSMLTNIAKKESSFEEIKLFFSALPLKRLIESGSRGLFYLIVGTICTLSIFYLINLYILNKKILLFVYLGTIGFGIYVLKFGMIISTLPVMFFGLSFAVWGFIALWPAVFRKLSSLFIYSPINYPLAMILFLLNYLIIYYHFAAISLPALTLDSDNYLAIYNLFKYDIIDLSATGHKLRLIPPFLASLIPIENPVMAFKIVNTIFLNLAVITLFKSWKDLQIKLYLIWLAFLWLFFHQDGMIRFYNFWPTNPYPPAFFFMALLIYITINNKYKWLLLVSPLAVFCQEGIIIYIFALFGYKLVCYLNSSEKNPKDFEALKFTLISLLLSVIAIQLISSLLYPSRIYSFAIMLHHWFILYMGGSETLMLFKFITIAFSTYGAFLIFLTLGFRFWYRSNYKYNLLIVLCITAVALNTLFISHRHLFLAYPILMPLILLSTNTLPTSLVFIGFLLSLPLMNIILNYPFVLYSSPLITENSSGMLSTYVLYMILLYHLLSYLQDIKVDDKVQHVLNYLRIPKRLS